MAATQNIDETTIFQIEKLAELSLEKCRRDPEEGIKIAEEVLSISNSNNCPSGVAKGLACKGACLVWIASYDKALEALFECLPKLQDAGDKKFETHTLYHIFCAYYFLADYDNALKYAHEMLHKAEKNEDLLSQANAHNAIGCICYATNENKKALEALLNGLTIANTLDDKHLIARILDGIGTSHFNLNEMEKSIEFKKKALEVSRSVGSKHIESYAIDGLAKIYLAADDFSNAEKYLHECLTIRQELNFKSGIAETNFQLGDLYLNMNRLDYALSHLSTALKIAEETNTKEVAYKTHKSLYTLYEKQGNTTKFIEHFKVYYTLKEEFFSEKNKQKIKDVEMQTSISQMETEKELLNQKNKHLESLSNDLVKLSDLGKTITSLLSIEAVNKTAYNIINNMMDAHGFGIGIVNENNDFLNFPGYIEQDVVLRSAGYELTDENRLATVCFNKELEIVINNYDLEVGKYIQKRLQPVIGASVQSIIYLPLKLGEKKLGVLTVQSFNKNAFDDYKVNLVKNLAVYCAIAIENATLYQKSEKRVEERTREVINAQETTRMLSVIGKEIISTTDFNSIFNKLHQKVGQLMNADCFSVRVYQKNRHEIDYKYSMEKGKLKTPLTVSMNDIDNYSVWCVTHNKEIFINDNLNEYHKYTKKIVVPSGEMPSSLLFCPLNLGDRVTGVITVQSFEKNAYTPFHMDVLKTLGTYTAIALENANLIEHLEDKVNERTSEVFEQKEQLEKSFRNSKLLSEIGKEIASTLSIDDIISTVYSQINTLMDATIFGIGIHRPEMNDLYFSGSMEKGEKLNSFAFNLNDEKTATVCFLQCKEFVINDWKKEYKHYIQQAHVPIVGDQPESLIYMPLLSKGKAIGVITVQSFEKHVYNDPHLDLLRSLSVYVGGAIENANLYKGLEERVVERTQEVIHQKEQIEKSHENTRLLSKIGQHIISNINIDAIFGELHKNIGQLMNADCFGVRIYYPKLNQIEYRYEIENGELFEPLSVSMDNEDNYSVWCVKNKQEIFINDNLNEYQKYTKKIVVPTGNMPSSLLFCPMMIGERVIGVITAQSFKTNAYLPLHMDILKTLGTYTAIALENANLVENLEEKVAERTKEVVKQKEIIEEANKHITDSIKYAKKIQQALLKNEKHESKHLPPHFILFKPKDIISGDFYWALEKNNHLYIAAGDCTGHGVPGALLTMLGTSFLNEINACEKLLTPSEVLDQLRSRFIKELNQTGMSGENKDGMDISLIRIKLVEKSSDNQSYSTELMWAGANNPLYLISKTNKILETIGDDKTRLIKNNTVITAVLPTKQPIGYYSNMSPFKNHTLAVNKGDYVCMFTDGYADQFGGPKGKKYKYSALKEKLLSIWELPMEEQKQQLLSEFAHWKGTLEQVDDVCVIGLRV